MVGWRHFGVEIGGDAEVLARALHGELGDYDEDSGGVKIEGGFLCLCIRGYRDSPATDSHLIEMLERSRGRGYYVTMNNTTDTGEGLIRFERSGELVDITDLVVNRCERSSPHSKIREDEVILDGENSRLPEFQLGAPDWRTVYELLRRESMPVAGEY